MSSVYHDPEQFGLAIVGGIDRGRSYEFDMFVVWNKMGTKRLLYATDSGCSCPSPFEGTGLNDLKDFTMTALEAWLGEGYEQAEVSQVRELKAAVRAVRGR